jgi:serine/threonine-protein kinase
MDSHGAMIEQTLRKAAWPNNRPISKIVFPKLFQVDSQVLATLWFMVSAQELKTLQSQSAIASDHCHIITCSSPHPMILWATTVGTQLEHPQWLSCFLDLKTKKGDLITRVLAEQGRYRVLFFALENPQCCAHVIQRQDLQSWKNTSQTLSVAGNPEESKQILRTELNYLKSNFLNQPPSFTEDHLKQPLSSTPKAKSSISFPSPFSKLWQGWSNALNKS